ncbi:sugar ABC transporter permease [Xylanibacillus composti]|uniref:Sugar ABC transporter permease n=1 Tax=Xylanibacillus composti TaxID=1572762 RepID=A0A8J4M404_9BACL|nr:sugar ABC transporter permease [Xylanibacillus composti]MDT9726155.1 sugar ABC transporter permease [Xylanibacillus composti]GIQ70610.1 sugar ABC transporter permease [Xylanibacillus composti]
MKANTQAAQPVPGRKAGTNRFWFVFKQQKLLYLMSMPFVAWVIVFQYVPLWGWTIAFQNYKPARSFFEQEWVGLKHFRELLQDERFYLALKNTLAMSVMGLIVGFTVPILFAVLLNELRWKKFKSLTQTISYLPHFVSWVVVAGLVYKMLSLEDGGLNQLLMWLGAIDQPIQFMAKGEWFWGIVVLSDLWKEMGWNSIIFLAAISAVDPHLYEAAKVDGAGRWRQIWHVTLPGIRAVIIVLLILSIGNLISIGFEKQYLLGNHLVVDYAEVLDLYALKYGLQLSRFSFGTAIGIFNSMVALLLVFTANALFKRYSNESVV